MTEVLPLMAEEVDAAWLTAQQANEAFDTWRETRDALAAIRTTRDLGIRGPTMDGVLREYIEKCDTYEASFDELVARASAVMLHPESPFALRPSSEQDWRAPAALRLTGDGLWRLGRTAYDALVSSLRDQDITVARIEAGVTPKVLRHKRDFYEYFGTSEDDQERTRKAPVTRMWNAVRQAATIVIVPDFMAYEGTVARAPANSITVVLHAGSGEEQFDAYSLRTALVRTDLLGQRHLGAPTFDRLVEYVNATFPHLEPLLPLSQR
jgi:hypothetical protein